MTLSAAVFICVVLVALTSAYPPDPVKLDCDLQNNYGCNSKSIFKFEHTGENHVPNSRCRHTYQLEITLTSQFKSVECRFYMDVPEQEKFVYSISQSATAMGANPSTPYIYGRGLDAEIVPQIITHFSPYSANYFHYNNLHHVDGINYYKAVAYKFSDGQLHMRSTSGDEMRIGHPNMFKPTSNTIYIGLNRRYATKLDQGSGLCRFICLGYKYGHPEADEPSADPGMDGETQATTEKPNGSAEIPSYP